MKDRFGVLIVLVIFLFGAGFGVYWLFVKSDYDPKIDARLACADNYVTLALQTHSTDGSIGYDWEGLTSKYPQYAIYRQKLDAVTEVLKESASEELSFDELTKRKERMALDYLNFLEELYSEEVQECLTVYRVAFEDCSREFDDYDSFRKATRDNSPSVMACLNSHIRGAGKKPLSAILKFDDELRNAAAKLSEQDFR